jgi:hypothetical protein
LVTGRYASSRLTMQVKFLNRTGQTHLLLLF